MNGPGRDCSGNVTGMSVPPDERLPAARVLSHLGVMAAVAAVMGALVAGLAIPFAGVVGVAARDAWVADQKVRPGKGRGPRR